MGGALGGRDSVRHWNLASRILVIDQTGYIAQTQILSTLRWEDRFFHTTGKKTKCGLGPGILTVRQQQDRAEQRVGHQGRKHRNSCVSRLCLWGCTEPPSSLPPTLLILLCYRFHKINQGGDQEVYLNEFLELYTATRPENSVLLPTSQLDKYQPFKRKKKSNVKNTERLPLGIWIQCHFCGCVGCCGLWGSHPFTGSCPAPDIQHKFHVALPEASWSLQSSLREATDGTCPAQLWPMLDPPCN